MVLQGLSLASKKGSWKQSLFARCAAVFMLASFTAPLLAVPTTAAVAAEKRKAPKKTQAKKQPAPYTPPYAALVRDANSGTVLHARSADERRRPASLTKVMTLYVLFSELDAGRIDMLDKIPMSRNGANQAPSRLGLKPGETIEVHEAIQALVVRSANDVAAAIGDYLAGSEAKFAAHMTETAHKIGMKNSEFRNASGLPNKDQWTTARDMATLAIRMQQDFPGYYSYFNVRNFDWNGQVINSHNRFLKSFEGADGLKTGFTNASGFNLIASANRGGKKLIGVVMGGQSSQARDARMVEIMTSGFAQASDPKTPIGKIVPASSDF